MSALGDDRVARDLLMLPRLLRRAGVHVNAERARVYLQAIAAIDLERPEDVRAASRTALVSRQADLAPFEMTFDLFWSLLRGGRLTASVPSARPPKAEASQIEVPLGQLAVVPGTSHGVVIEKPELVSRLIGHFLSAPGKPETYFPVRRRSAAK